MASVFKPTYTKPIPPAAEIVTIKGKPHARLKRRGRTLTVPLTDDGTKLLIERKQWHVRYRDADGRWVTVKGYTDRQATDQLAAELVRRAERKEQGLIDPFEEQRRRPLAEQLADYRAALEGKGNAAGYVGLVFGRLNAVAGDCGWKTLTDLSLAQAQEWLSRQR